MDFVACGSPVRVQQIQFCCEYRPVMSVPRAGVKAEAAVWWFSNVGLDKVPGVLDARREHARESHLVHEDEQDVGLGPGNRRERWGRWGCRLWGFAEQAG